MTALAHVTLVEAAAVAAVFALGVWAGVALTLRRLDAPLRRRG